MLSFTLTEVYVILWKNDFAKNASYNMSSCKKYFAYIL